MNAINKLFSSIEDDINSSTYNYNKTVFNEILNFAAGITRTLRHTLEENQLNGGMDTRLDKEYKGDIIQPFKRLMDELGFVRAAGDVGEIYDDLCENLRTKFRK